MNEIQIFDGRDVPRWWNPDLPEDHGPACEYLESRGRRADNIAQACRTIMEATDFIAQRLKGIDLRQMTDLEKNAVCNIRLELENLTELAFTDLEMPSAIEWVKGYAEALDRLMVLMGIRYHEWRQERIDSASADLFEGIDGYTVQCHDLYLTKFEDGSLIARCKMVRHDHHHELQQMTIPKQLKTLGILECSGNKVWIMTHIKRARLLAVIADRFDADGYTTLYVDNQKSVKTAYGRGNKPHEARVKDWIGSTNDRDIIRKILTDARGSWAAREAVLRAR